MCIECISDHEPTKSPTNLRSSASFAKLSLVCTQGLCYQCFTSYKMLQQHASPPSRSPSPCCCCCPYGGTYVLLLPLYSCCTSLLLLLLHTPPSCSQHSLTYSAARSFNAPVAAAAVCWYCCKVAATNMPSKPQHSNP
jgi:hypothetical protein